jgi:hypothetical protein
MESGTNHKNVALCGLWRPITGWPNSNKKEWRRSGASKTQTTWLDEGYLMKFKHVVPPIGCGAPWQDGNHPGASEHTHWLHSVAAEFLVLGILSELPHRAMVVCSLNVIPKSDYNAEDVKKMWRLRLLLDQRPTNTKLEVETYRAESLNQARWVIEKGDVTISWDYAAYFYHYLNAIGSREYMGCTLDAAGPMGGRFFCWNAPPMGTSTSGRLTQSLAWVLAKKWRRLGIRCLSYSDDNRVWCKPEQVADIVAMIERDFIEHGLLQAPSKRQVSGKVDDIALGIGMNLETMMFYVPMEKKIDIVAECKAIINEVRKKIQVRVRRVASVTSKIMALHIAIGNVARRMTRCLYVFVARITGVPVNCTKRDLRVAWECFALPGELEISELQFFADSLMDNKGSPIHPEEPYVTIEVGQDAGERAWFGFMDAGLGRRLLARDELDADEEKLSSSEREALACERNLMAFEHKIVRRLEEMAERLSKRENELAGRRVMLTGDSQVVALAIEVGSNNPRIQAITRRIWQIGTRMSVELSARWRRRNTGAMQMCDDGTKVDLCDYQISPAAFKIIQEKLGVKHTIDCFATRKNRLCERFLSKYHCDGVTGVDFYEQSLQGEVCWAHPPRGEIAKSIRHLRCKKAQGTILVPHDSTTMWWPLVTKGAKGMVKATDGGPCDTGDLRWRMQRKRGLLWKQGKPMAPGYRDLVAVRFDFRALGA